MTPMIIKKVSGSIILKILSTRINILVISLNNKNSLLVDVKQVEADERYQYWRVNKGAKVYMPSVEHLSQQIFRPKCVASERQKGVWEMPSHSSKDIFQMFVLLMLKSNP